MGLSNYGFFYQKKVFENFRIALKGIGINIVYKAKSRRFRFQMSLTQSWQK